MYIYIYIIFNLDIFFIIGKSNANFERSWKLIKFGRKVIGEKERRILLLNIKPQCDQNI